MRLLLFFCFWIPVKLLLANVQIDLMVTNQTSNTATISYQTSQNKDDLRVFQVNLKSGSPTSFYLELSQPTFVNFEYNGFEVPMFLSPNENLSIQFNANAPLNTLAFGGNASENNNFVAQLFRTIGSSKKNNYEYGYIPFTALQGVIQKYRNNPNSIKTLENRLLIDLSSRRNLSSQFISYFQNYIIYELAAAQLAIQIENGNILKKANFQALISKSQNQLTGSVHPSVENFYKAYAIASVLPADLHQYRLYNIIYDKAAQNFTGTPKLYALKEIMITAYSRSADEQFVQNRFEDYLKINTNKSFEKEIIAAIGADIGTNEELTAPDIRLYTENDQYINLHDYKGKVVYLSFWASYYNNYLYMLMGRA